MNVDGGVFGIVNELAKNSNIPTDVLNNHVTQLRSMVGKKSGTVQEIQTKKLRELAKKAEKGEFMKHYNEASALGKMSITIFGLNLNRIKKFV